MRTYFGNALDPVFNDMIDLVELASNSQFFTNLQKFADDSCKEAPETSQPVTGILSSNIKSVDNNYLITAEVPGLDEEKISVEYKDNKLSISASYEDQDGIRKGNWVTTFRIKDADPSGISAKLDKGQLIVTVPKKAEAQPIKIEINK